MAIKTLRAFQENAIESGLTLFSTAKRLLDAAGDDESGQQFSIAHNGALLIEAPTGCGKTLMAGSIVEKFTATENVVWFWFAPFKGVVGQTEDFLREQFQGLRLRDLAADRGADASGAGDTFVTTWQTVATRVRDKRNVRKETETNPSIDTLAESLRAQGLRIGVVVDEAHHGFGGDTQALKFFKEVLRPHYTILVTATPDDADIKAFEKAMDIAELHRIRVSRADAVEAGLIKAGVKAIAYVVTDPAKAGLVDLQATALRDGVGTHRKIKDDLKRLGVDLVPLLLVQVDSAPKSIEKARERLLKFGFTDDQIAVHTASEPDADLLAIANDERREVLIFKMAVALGFDAPRAFTLVSMRASRDRDFGVQLIGRILRVHRLLQGRVARSNFPPSLNNGYVFLSNFETQTGLDQAGQLINKIETEYAKVSPATIVLRVGDEENLVGMVDNKGQVSFLLPQQEAAEVEDFDLAHSPGEVPVSALPIDLFEKTLKTPVEPSPDAARIRIPPPPGIFDTTHTHSYKLRHGMPHSFRRQIASPDNASCEEACAQNFIDSTRDLFDDAKKGTVGIEKRTLEVFTHAIQQEFNFAASLSPEQAAHAARAALCSNETFDPRELRRALLKKLSSAMHDEAIEGADDPAKVLAFLNFILAYSPRKLADAQKKALATHTVVENAEPLPETYVSDEPLPVSPHNIYGIYPDNSMNKWERLFAEFLDRDPNGIVLWWHRNEPRKPWSVNVLRPSGKGFFPDFIIGINGRRTPEHVLMADPKKFFQMDEEAEKVWASHAEYGKALILIRNESNRWMAATWDDERKKAVAETEFHLSNAAAWGL